MRGAAFAFRSYGEPDTGWQRAWTRVFGIASLVTPFVLGMCAGRDRVGPDPDQSTAIVHADLWASWTGPLSWVAGLLSLAMCAYLAAVVPDRGGRPARRRPELERRFRRRALVRGVVGRRPRSDRSARRPRRRAVLWNGMLEDGWPFVVLVGRRGRRRAGRDATGGASASRDRAAAVAVASVIAGWGVAQWPYLIVPDLTAAEAAAPKSSLGPIVIGLVVGAALVAPSLFLLFRVFKASQGPDTAPGQASSGSSTSS